MGIAVLGYGYLQLHVRRPAVNDWLIFAVCPPSIGLMASDSGKWYSFVVADSIVVIVNAAWYGLLFAVGVIIRKHWIMDKLLE